MASLKRTKEIWEYGDFQTPDELAIQIVTVLQQLSVNPASVIEPTCGKGNLLIGAIKAYPRAQRFIGADINGIYLDKLRQRLISEELEVDMDILHSNFFDTNWDEILSILPEPLLIIGNPPG